MAPDASIYFERVAVTEEQIVELDLPTRPTKRTDSRARHFRGESVEVDAIPPQALRDLAQRCITCHVDADVLERTERIEEEERTTLAAFAGMHRAGEVSQ